MVTGFPCSGKTTRSLQLKELLEQKISETSSRFKVEHITSPDPDRAVYKEARTEKNARAAEYSAVKRALGKETIVIADGLNYIKGYRYQLFCEAKEAATTSCVVSFLSYFLSFFPHHCLCLSNLRYSRNLFV